MKKRIVIISAILAVLTAGTLTYTTFAPKPAAVAPTQATAQVLAPPTAQELLDAVNAERAKADVAPLTLKSTLTQSAQWKADDMRDRHYMSHYDPVTGEKNGLKYFWSIDPYTCKTISENYYWASGDYRTVSETVKWWMNSKLHHDAMLDPKYELTGFGIVFAETMIIVEHFCDVE